MASTKRVTLDLTTEQEETIKALFAHNNWDYIEVEPTPGKLFLKKKYNCFL